MIERILFICMGNAARSPVCEYLTKHYSKRRGLKLIVESAGFINAFSFMLPESSRFLSSKGINHSDFRPQLVNNELLKRQDLIITMEMQHKNELINNFMIEDIEKKTFTLKEFNGCKNDLDIIDPYYTNNETYDKILLEIDANIQKLVDKIVKLNKLN